MTQYYAVTRSVCLSVRPSHRLLVDVSAVQYNCERPRSRRDTGASSDPSQPWSIHPIARLRSADTPAMYRVEYDQPEGQYTLNDELILLRGF